MTSMLCLRLPFGGAKGVSRTRLITAPKLRSGLAIVGTSGGSGVGVSGPADVIAINWPTAITSDVGVTPLHRE